MTDDLPIEEAEVAGKSEDEVITYFYGLYDQASTNCLIAAAIYAVVFAFSFLQHRINVRANYVMS